MNFRIEQIKEKVNKTVELFLKQDSFLIKYDVNERSITHKLAEYLQEQFPEFSVDCEYNRMKDKNMDTEFITKKLNLDIEGLNSDDTTAKTVYPDIIIHRRGTSNNLLVIEVKKSSSKVNKIIDIKKLNKFTTNSEYLYEYGLFILFYTGDTFKNNPKLEWYKNGRKLENE